MGEGEVSIEAAGADDLEELLELLSAVGLPREGVAEHLEGFLLARSTCGVLAGCVGLERHGRLGLLRSAAVAPGRQRSGLGSRLAGALLERARAAGVEEVLLLTTTAREFFGRRFGFEEASRADYEGRLDASTEWGLPRCSTAVLMRLDLKTRGAKDND